MKQQTIGSVIIAGIQAGLDTATILASVKEAFPAANTTANSVAFYRSKLKKAGGSVPSPAKPTVIGQAPAAKPVAAEATGYEARAIKSTTGMEGPGFLCKLYRDGKHVAVASDFGDGGPVHWAWADAGGPPGHVVELDLDGKETQRKGTVEEATFALFCRHHTYQQSWEGSKVVPHSMDTMVEELVNDALLLKKVRAMTKKGIAMVEDGKLYTLRLEPTEANLAKHKAANPKAVFLNGLSDQAQLAVVRALQG